MPKMKSSRSAAKRFRASATGKIRRRQSGMNHILTSKSAKRKRHLRKVTNLDSTDEGRVRALLPYL
jgi:large subunit ribosomal protein L35